MTNDFDDSSFLYRKELQIALREFMTDMKMPLFPTICLNRATSHERAARILRDFQQLIDRKMFGRRFYKLHRSDRSFFIAVPEKAKNKSHYHLVLRVPKHKELFFKMNAWFYLRQGDRNAKIVTLHVETAEEIRKTSFYSRKDSWQRENYDNSVISTQFASFKKRYHQ